MTILADTPNKNNGATHRPPPIVNDQPASRLTPAMRLALIDAAEHHRQCQSTADETDDEPVHISVPLAAVLARILDGGIAQ